MIAPGDLFEIGLVVADIEASIEQFHKSLGYTFNVMIDGELTTRGVEGDTAPPMKLAVTQEVHPQIELLEAAPGTFLVPPSGTALHHLGYYVDDLKAASAALTATGVPFARGGLHDGDCPVSWAYHEMADGTIIELVDRQSAPARAMLTVGQVPDNRLIGSSVPIADGWRFPRD